MKPGFFLSLVLIFAALLGKGMPAATDSASAGGKLTFQAYIFKENKRTKDHILHRELPLQQGEKVNPYEVQRILKSTFSRLMNTRLFNDVEVRDSIAGNDLYILCTFKEKWYIYPLPVFDRGGVNVASIIKNRDFHLMSFGASLKHFNFRGRKEYLSISAMSGFSRHFSIDYNIPGINKKRTLGLLLSAGLGANSKINVGADNCRLQTIRAGQTINWVHHYAAGVTWRPKFFTKHEFMISYDYERVADTVVVENPSYFTNGHNKMGYFRMDYFLEVDKRDWRAYPLDGYQIELEASKIGFGLEPVNTTNIFRTQLKVDYFEPLADRLYAAASAAVELSYSKFQPYVVQSQTALGFDQYARGFEPYIIQGQHFGLIKTNLRYELLPRKVFHLKKVKWNEINTFPLAIYLGVHADAAYVSDRQMSQNNPLANEVNSGYGIGLDVVTAYDAVFRFEYSFNSESERNFFFSIGKAF